MWQKLPLTQVPRSKQFNNPNKRTTNSRADVITGQGTPCHAGQNTKKQQNVTRLRRLEHASSRQTSGRFTEVAPHQRPHQGFEDGSIAPVFLRASAPPSSSSLSLPFCKPAQYVMKELAEQITSVGDLVNFFPKQKLFLAFQIDQHIAARPTIKNCFLFPSCLLIQTQYCSKELGRSAAPKTKATRLHTYFAMSQLKNKW